MLKRCGAFVGKVQTHESLRMLTLFTYADIAAVHPDALTPWKAENLWRLYIAAANQLDRNVDEVRVHTRVSGGALGGWRKDEKITRVLSLVPGREAAMEQFLEGFPERYVSTRTAEAMRQHFEMTQHFGEDLVPDDVSAWGDAFGIGGERDHPGDPGTGRGFLPVWRRRWLRGE